jgi:hypothetical protein
MRTNRLRGNPRFPLTPSRPFGKELSLTIYSNENFYDFFDRKILGLRWNVLPLPRLNPLLKEGASEAAA